MGGCCSHTVTKERNDLAARKGDLEAKESQARRGPKRPHSYQTYEVDDDGYSFHSMVSGSYASFVTVVSRLYSIQSDASTSTTDNRLNTGERGGGGKLARSRSEEQEDELTAAMCQHLLDRHCLLGAAAEVRRLCARHGVADSRAGTAIAHLVPNAAEVLRIAGQVEDSLQLLDTREGWPRPAYDGAELKMFYRGPPKGSHVHTFKFQATFKDNDAVDILSLMREMDLVSSWNRYVLDSSILREATDFDLQVYCGLWLPWPYKERQVVLSCSGYDVLKTEDSLVITMETASPSEVDLEQLPKSAARRVFVTMMRGSIVRLTPRRGSSTHGSEGARGGKEGVDVSGLLAVDPHVSFIPEFIINFLIRVLSPYIMRMAKRVIHQQFQDPASPYRSRMAARAHFYTDMSARFAAAPMLASTRVGAGDADGMAPAPQQRAPLQPQA